MTSHTVKSKYTFVPTEMKYIRLLQTQCLYFRNLSSSFRQVNIKIYETFSVRISSFCLMMKRQQPSKNASLNKK